jgi:hypothetical protein
MSERVRTRWTELVRPLVPPAMLQVYRLAQDATNPRGLWAYVDSDRRCSADTYIPWLCQVTGGWLTPQSGNIRAFDHAVRHAPQGAAFLEIGSFLGLSTNLISYLLAKHGRSMPFFSTDPWVFEGTEKPIGGFFDAASSEYREYAREVFLRNGQVFGGSRRSHAFELTSDAFFQMWDSAAKATDLYGRVVEVGGQFGFVYIDGDHTYEQCRRDFENADRHLAPGGYILFDDSADASSHDGSRRFVQELRAQKRYRLVFRQPNYFFQKRS